MSNSPSRVLRFGVFELDVAAGELRRDGLKVKLQNQPVRVLTLLLKRAGEVVPRDEFRRQIWPADTFVDFDRGLSTAINKIREALGDSADNPRFVETVPRRGYRFIAPVEGANKAETVLQKAVAPAAAAAPVAGQALAQTQVTEPRFKRQTWLWVAAAVGMAFLLGFLGRDILVDRGDPRSAPENLKVSRVTSTPEMEWDHSATPTSSLIAYSSATAGNMDIYVMPLAGGTALQLTDYPSDETQPSLSPDGNLIAFHSNRGGGTLYTVPVTGGTPRLLALTNEPSFFPTGMGLSPWRAKSGRQELLFARTEADGRRAIWKIDLTSREETQLSRPEARERHIGASYSPDGEQIVFGQGGDLWTMPAEGGDPRRVLQGGAGRASWTPDGSRLLFQKQKNLWELTIATGELRQITVGPGLDWGPILIPGKGLFYTQFNHSFDLFSVDLKSREHKALTAASDISQIYPRFSPDGRFVVFDSNRGGDYEIFKLDLGSGETTPLTDNTVRDRYPDWAPTSHELVFVSSREGETALWLMDAEGAKNRRLDLGPGAVRPRLQGSGEESGAPRWAPTGSVVGYVGAGESGPELWSVQTDGGGARRLLSGVHSFDWYGESGRVVVYSSTGGEQFVGAELRAVNLDTNEEVVLLEGLYANLDVAPDGSSVAYVTQDGHMSQQYFLLPLTPPGETDGLPRAAGPPEQFIDGGGLWHTHAGSFSSDGSSFVYDRDLDEGDILLIENFE